MDLLMYVGLWTLASTPWLAVLVWALCRWTPGVPADA